MSLPTSMEHTKEFQHLKASIFSNHESMDKIQYIWEEEETLTPSKPET